MATIDLNFNYPDFIKPALFNNNRITTIVAGRQVGKTYNGGQWLTEELITATEEEQLNYNLGGLWVDTTNANLDKYVDRVFKKILRPVWELCHWEAQKKILHLPPLKHQRPYIDFGSAERPENLEGQAYYRGVLNEAGIILKKPSLWDSTLSPMFKNEFSRVKVVGTPKGRNKFHNLSVTNPNYHFSVYDSPYWTKDEIESKRKTTPIMNWKQEYLAEFLENTGSIFRNIQDGIKEIRTKDGDLMAIDLAKYDDFTVIMIGNSKTKEVIHIERFNQTDWGYQKKMIYELWGRFGKPKTIVDSTGVGDAIYDDLKSAGMNIIPFKFTAKSKKELIENLSISLQNSSIFFPKNDMLISELESFEYTLTKSGNVIMSSPEGMHDDMVIALALLNRIMQDYIPLEISFV